VVQLADATPNFKRNIFVAFDVDTTFGVYPNITSKGISWVIKPPYAGSSVLDWQLSHAKNPALKDRQYGAIALLHTLATNTIPTGNHNGKNRLIAFGGATPDPQAPSNWTLNTGTEEYAIADGKDPNDGVWITHSQGILSPRIYINAVILPTGEILIIGGAQINASGNPNVGEFSPEIYYPGDAGTGAGSSSTMMAPAYGSTHYYPRLYHNFAMLLPDGRVLNVGGTDQQVILPPAPGLTVKDPRFSGEIFSPPYKCSSFTPSISSAPTEADFGSSFNVTIQHEDVFSNFVLLRPASVTHNFDADQRYIELSATHTDSEAPFSIYQVTAPAEDLGPAGYYMLFVVATDAQGMRVPSNAHFIRLK
jgi:hypothetical protein